MSTASGLDRHEAIRRRRAIFTGLSAHMDREAARRALALWQTEFSHRPVFALHDFLARLYPDPGHRSQRADLHRALVSALSGDEAALLPDPGPPNAGSDGRGSAGVAQESAVHVFTALFAALMRRAARHGADAGVRVRVARRLVDLGLSAPTLKSLSEWVVKKEPRLPVELGLGTLRKLVHYGYLALCEELGPVAADRLLAEAVREAETHANALDFHPRTLL